MNDLGHWHYDLPFDPDDFFGFVYTIRDRLTDRHYIGKKQFHQHLTRKTTAKTGRTTRRRYIKPSDWRSYKSSSKLINSLIRDDGTDRFEFTILSLHETRSGLHYAEIEQQIFQDVLRARLPDGTRKFYNNAIGNIRFIPPAMTANEKLHRTLAKLLLEYSKNSA